MDFSPEDIARIEAAYDSVHASTRLVLLSSNPADADQHQTELNTTMGGLDALVTYYDRKVREFQSLRDAAKDKKRDLERDFDAAKRCYWRLKEEQKRSGIPSNS